VDAIEVIPAIETTAAALVNRFNEACDRVYGRDQHEISNEIKSIFSKFCE